MSEEAASSMLKCGEVQNVVLLGAFDDCLMRLDTCTIFCLSALASNRRFEEGEAEAAGFEAPPTAATAAAPTLLSPPPPPPPLAAAAPVTLRLILVDALGDLGASVIAAS